MSQFELYSRGWKRGQIHLRSGNKIRWKSDNWICIESVIVASSQLKKTLVVNQPNKTKDNLLRNGLQWMLSFMQACLSFLPRLMNFFRHFGFCLRLINSRKICPALLNKRNLYFPCHSAHIVNLDHFLMPSRKDFLAVGKNVRFKF